MHKIWEWSSSQKRSARETWHIVPRSTFLLKPVKLGRAVNVCKWFLSTVPKTSLVAQACLCGASLLWSVKTPSCLSHLPVLRQQKNGFSVLHKSACCSLEPWENMEQKSNAPSFYLIKSYETEAWGQGRLTVVCLTKKYFCKHSPGADGGKLACGTDPQGGLLSCPWDPGLWTQ